MLLTKAIIHASWAGVSTLSRHEAGRLTMPMEIVARAKGSPIMRPTLNEARWGWPYPDSILRREGEGDPEKP